MDASVSTVANQASVTGEPNPSLRVLVVDDDADSRQMLESTLITLGHQCLGAGDGAEAVAIQQTQSFDVILSDWSMPVMTGVELCRFVRSHRSGGYTCFLFLTSFADRAHLLEGLRAGADDYLTKPVDFEELEVRLRCAGQVVLEQRALAEGAPCVEWSSAASSRRVGDDWLL